MSDASLDARLAQWQQRMNVANRMLAEPQRQGETPEAYQRRQAAAHAAIRIMQADKPTGINPQGQGTNGRPNAPQQAPGPFNGIAGIYDRITQALSGARK